MAIFKIKIDSILGGWSPGFASGSRNQFQASLNIDPDHSVSSALEKAAHQLIPGNYVDFSSTALTAAARWLLTNDKDALMYAYLNNGRLLSYAVDFAANESTVISAITGGNGSGAAYYNNYLYLAEAADITRYGPLDGTPSEEANVWTGATLGSQTALTDTTYPTIISNMEYPNHPMYVHVNNKLYIGDYINGQGLIHSIKTRKVTDEGDTNDGSAYNDLDLPFGYKPIDIQSYGNDLVILAFKGGSSVSVVQGKAALFLWDTVSASFYRQISLNDPFASALLNHNGRLIIFSGNLINGVRVSEYLGGFSFKSLAFIENALPPFSAAVESLGQRIVFGTSTTFPVESACVFSIGYKNIVSNALHNIINTDAVAGVNNPVVTALMQAQQKTFSDPELVVAWADNSNQGIDEKGAVTQANDARWRSMTYNIGQPFKVTKVSLGFGEAIQTNHTLLPILGVDNRSSTTNLTTINSTNFANSELRVVLYPSVIGRSNFELTLQWSGSRQLPVTLPIIIEGETLKDYTF